MYYLRYVQHMTTLRRTFVFLFFWVLAQGIGAQIMAPQLTCVSNDSLHWVPAVNNCGPFIATDIYASNLRSGPYAILASITDSTVTSYFTANQSPQYYYLQVRHDCPGQMPTSSDTLDNQFGQLVTKIERVTVIDNDVEITWLDNGAPQTIGYIIYGIRSIGTVPLDTVFGGLSYLDTTGTPMARPESYFVRGLDACGLRNAFDTSPHTTVHLTLDFDFCARFVELNWTLYEGWDGGIDNNQIWWGIDGTPLAFEHRQPAVQELFYLTGIHDEREYCMAIRAEQTGTGIASWSNVICEVSDVLRPVETLDIKNVTVTPTDEVVIDWCYNAEADVRLIELYRSEDTATLVAIDPNIGAPPSSDINQFVDPAADVQSQVYVYRLLAIDDCDSTEFSYDFSTVHAAVSTGSGGENMLQWSPLFIPGRTLVEYVVCRLSGGMEVELGRIPATAPRAFREVISSDQPAGDVCYVIKATHQDTGGGDMRTSRSNVACTVQMVEMYVPNAFAPRGLNSTFKPGFAFPGNIRQYQMTIFDRWGGTLFETSNFEEGWNGRVDGRLLEPGVYAYVIIVDQADGSTTTRSGTVTLVR